MKLDEPKPGDVMILEHTDGSVEFFGRAGRVTHYNWQKLLRQAKLAARPHAVWLQRDGESPQRIWTPTPGEMI
jgi:hypothetical protein